MSLGKLRRLAAFGILAALAAWPFGWAMARRLPAPRQTLAELAQAPRQTPAERAPFAFEYKGKRCEVRPVARYELWGLVVSHNDIASVSDIYHDATSVDTRDLCVVWGENVTRGVYRDAEFRSGPWTCYVRTPQGVELDLAGVGNNHLITDRPELRAALARVHRGDQVHLSGLLVDYRMEDWGSFWRRTSTVREDSGCEVVFLEDFEVLRAHAPVWNATVRLAKALVVALPILWLGLFALETRRDPVSAGRLG